MFRLMRLKQKIASCKNFLHTFKSRELDIPEFHKKPLDPQVLSLVKDYNEHIHYSSHIELNKKPLTYEQRINLMSKLRQQDFVEQLGQANASEPSILVEKFTQFRSGEEENDGLKSKPLSNEESSIASDGEDKAEHELAKRFLAKSKLKILTEMGLRRSALEYEIKSFPDNWMEDYETFDENDHLADTQYGTPGKTLHIIYIDLKSNSYIMIIEFRSEYTDVKCALPWMWVDFAMRRYKFAWLSPK